MQPPLLLDFADPQGGTRRLRCAFGAPLRTLVAHTPEQVKPVLDAVQAAAQQGLWCVGYLRYEAASAFDAALQTHPCVGVLAWFGVFAQALPWPDDRTNWHGNEVTPNHDRGLSLRAQTRNPCSRNAWIPDVETPDLIRGRDDGHVCHVNGDANTNAHTNATAQASAAEPERDAPAVQWQSSLPRHAFDAAMARIHHAITAGDFYQINYTTLLHGQLAGDARALFARLHAAQPSGYAAFIDIGEEQVLSVSPELFFDWDGAAAGGHILTRPMKGTAARGVNATQDARQIDALTCSPKERAENVMIVDLLRNDLSRIAQPHSVAVPALFSVQTLPTVHQMVSDVTATTRNGTTLADVFGALFPCGSITGAPKVRAMQEIKALEPTARGIYCGTIGVVRPGGHATFNVAIRTVTLRDQLASCGIGSGITADATADAEWQEWQIKQRFLERASAPFELLETLRLQSGEFHNLAAHLARLERAASHFGYPFDAVRVQRALDLVATDQRALQGVQSPTASTTATNTPSATASANATITWRVRLSLAANGQIHVEKFILNKPLAPVLIALAATPFEAFESEFTRFKTTRRAHYEAFAPTDPAIFDTLLYNPRGELTECTRGNIALLLDGQWLTPALHCGLLDGVGRAVALRQGRLREAVLHGADLQRAQGLAFINSLRGWLDARLATKR